MLQLRSTAIRPHAWFVMRLLLTALLAIQLTALRYHLLAEHHHRGHPDSHPGKTERVAFASDSDAWGALEAGHSAHPAHEHEFSVAGWQRTPWSVALGYTRAAVRIPHPPTHSLAVPAALRADPPPKPSLSPQGTRGPPAC